VKPKVTKSLLVKFTGSNVDSPVTFRTNRNGKSNDTSKEPLLDQKCSEKSRVTVSFNLDILYKSTCVVILNRNLAAKIL
jgi:hypothetical protein